MSQKSIKINMKTHLFYSLKSNHLCPSPVMLSSSYCPALIPISSTSSTDWCLKHSFLMRMMRMIKATIVQSIIMTLFVLTGVGVGGVVGLVVVVVMLLLVTWMFLLLKSWMLLPNSLLSPFTVKLHVVVTSTFTSNSILKFCSVLFILKSSYPDPGV